MRLKRWSIPLVAAALMLGVVSAQADPLSFTFSTGAVTMDKLGLEPGFPSNFDILDVTGLTDSNVALLPGLNEDILVNGFAFTSGINAYGARLDWYTLSRSFTAFGQTVLLAQPFSVEIGGSDTLTFFEGAPVSLFAAGVGTFVITPDGHAAGRHGGTGGRHPHRRHRVHPGPRAGEHAAARHRPGGPCGGGASPEEVRRAGTDDASGAHSVTSTRPRRLRGRVESCTAGPC